MKLFVFRPTKYGPNTYIVMSKDKKQATEAVKKYREEEEHVKDHTGYGGIDSKDDYGDNLYKIEIYDEGQVARNDND